MKLIFSMAFQFKKVGKVKNKRFKPCKILSIYKLFKIRKIKGVTHYKAVEITEVSPCTSNVGGNESVKIRNCCK